MGYSDKCSNLLKYWSLDQEECVWCDMKYIKPGYEFTPNCGYEDNGGRRVSRTEKCKQNFYNDGLQRACLPCSVCPTMGPAARCPSARRNVARPCNGTTDTPCCGEGKDCSKENAYDLMITGSSCPEVPQLGPLRDALWLAPMIVLVSLMFAAVSYLIYKRKRQSFEGRTGPAT